MINVAVEAVTEGIARVAYLADGEVLCFTYMPQEIATPTSIHVTAVAQLFPVVLELTQLWEARAWSTAGEFLLWYRDYAPSFVISGFVQSHFGKTPDQVQSIALKTRQFVWN